MKLAIFGATGATGAELVKQALENGHTVTALVRNPAALVEMERLQIISGDVLSLADVEKAVHGRMR